MSWMEPSEDLIRLWSSQLLKRPRITMECTPKEFRSKLEDFFRPFILSARSDGNFDRVCFSMASHDFAQHLRCPELASVYYSYVVQECYEFISVDKTTMLRTLKECITKKLEIHGFGKDTKDRFRHSSPDRMRLKRPHTFGLPKTDDEFYDYFKRNVLLRLYEKEKQKRIQVPYYARDITGCTLEQLLCKPFLYQDFECIKNLLLYIMPETFATDDLCYYTNDVMLRIELDPTLRGARYCKSLFSEYCNNSARRLKLLLMSVDFVVQKRCESNFGQECINSLKLLLSTIPDAMITSKEVSRFLQSIVNHLDCTSELLIDDFCRSFEEEFPLSALPLQPRSLKHLCKCEIRRTLSSVQQLPVGIGRMGIPIAMQEYLSLE